MFKFLTAPVLAASIALTGFSTAPARANNDDVAGFVAGLAALAIIGIAINESQSNQRSSSKKSVKKKYTQPRIQHYRPNVRQHKPQMRQNVQRARGKVVPARCLRVLETRQGPRRGFGAACLRNHRKTSAPLPKYCKSTVRSRGQVRTLYMARCLKNAGFRMSRI